MPAPGTDHAHDWTKGLTPIAYAQDSSGSHLSPFPWKLQHPYNIADGSQSE